jgi:hypothetical protein
MSIIGNEVVLGCSDVKMQTRIRGVFDPTIQVRFTQLENVAMEGRDLGDADKSIRPITITSDLKGIETLHRMLSDVLGFVYDRQLKQLDDYLQTQKI